MKYQAEVLLLKNKIRLLKGTIRHTWQGIVAVIAVGGIFLYQFFFVIVKVGYGIGATEKGIFYTMLFVAAVNLVRVFLNKTPVFRIEAASVLHTYNSGLFRKSIKRKQFRSVLSSIIVSGTVACVLSGFLFNFVFLKLWGIFFLYISSCTFLSWIFYHERGKAKWGACGGFSLCTALLFWHSVFAFILSGIFLCAVWIYCCRFLRMNMSKYFDQLQSIEAAAVAVSQNDYMRMQQLAEENRPPSVRGPLLYHFKITKQTALWAKSMLELIRTQKQIMLFLVILLLAGWIIGRTDLLAFIPLLDNPAITRVISAGCTTATLGSLYQLLVKQAKTVSDKRRLGLSLPYSTKQIIISYGMTAIILNLLLTLAISLLYAIFSIRLIPLFVAEMIAYIIPCCTQLYETKFQRGAVTISNMVLFAGVSWFLLS